MPARIVLAHDDPEFVHNTVPALRAAGYDVIAFADSMSALNALKGALRVEVLITRVLFPEGQPNGVSLGLMARLDRPSRYSGAYGRHRRVLAIASDCL